MIDPLMNLPIPQHVAILALGPSLDEYIKMAKRRGARRKVADETWGINAVADVIICDRVFHMDDIRIQEMRAELNPEGNIAAMLPWLKLHPGPIYTSIRHPQYPGTVDFPLEWLVNQLQTYAYFNGTVPYAVAYAIAIGVKRISFFGCDYTYKNAHHAEQGRACLEFWIGFARARGVEIDIAGTSTLLDSCEPMVPYGYDMVNVDVVAPEDGPVKFLFSPKDNPPTAEEIEARYNHEVHPNSLVRNATEEGMNE